MLNGGVLKQDRIHAEEGGETMYWSSTSTFLVTQTSEEFWRLMHI